MARKPSPHLCFVLLPKNELPKKAALAKALKEFPELAKATVSFDEDRSSVVLELGDTQAIAALMPAPVPNGEADGATERSLSALNGSWSLPAHAAHLVVVEGGSAPSLDALILFTRFVAVLTRASHAVGVYWGEAHATHHPEFVVDIAKSDLPLPVWIGVSAASGAKGFELLSIGMRQLALPDLLLRSPTIGGEALGFFFDLLAYVVNRGKKLPEGDTVGRDEKEKLKVKYVKSPIDPKARVWSVTLPGKK